MYAIPPLVPVLNAWATTIAMWIESATPQQIPVPAAPAIHIVRPMKSVRPTVAANNASAMRIAQRATIATLIISAKAYSLGIRQRR